MAQRALLIIVLLGAAALVAGGVASWRSQAPQAAVSSTTEVEGVVVNDEGPVEGALVRIKATAVATRSDAEGRFRLLLPKDDQPIAITAWKEGYLIGGAEPSGDDIRVRLTPLPPRDNPNYAWVDPTPDAQAEHNCGNCHREIHRQWSAGAHANSARNPRLLDLYAGTDAHGRPDRGWNLLKDMPEGAAVCASCHAPSLDFADPATDDLRHIEGVAAHGVHCDYCHKVRDVSLAAVGLAHGRFGMTLLRPSQGQLFFGPLDDVDRGEDVYSAVQSESRYCASCHEGTLFGVHVYSTYSEWLASPARQQGKQCQSCHMRPDGHLANIAPGAGGLERDPATLASHDLLPGGRQAMLRSCLRVDVLLTAVEQAVVCDVEVLAHAVGHRVPTGFIDRHLILTVQAFDVRGQLVAATAGPALPRAAGEDLSGQPGRLFARLLTDADGNAPLPFWRAVEKPLDTRLIPEQPDATQFRFSDRAAEVRVRLVYRRFWQEVAAAKAWPSDEVIVFDRSQRVVP